MFTGEHCANISTQSFGVVEGGRGLSQQLSGKVALVTGAARGLGAGIATRLAMDGATVICLDKEPPQNTADSINSILSNNAATARLLDVTDHGQVDGAFDEIAEQHGSIDVMVNNAGVAHRVADLLDTGDEVVEAVFAVNVFGLLACSRAAARVMISKGKGGRIINTASQAGKSAWPGWGVYSASKACVISLTQSLALELAPYKIMVNAICPGTMQTDMTRTGFSASLKVGQTLDGALAEKAASIPVGRLGTPEDMGAMVAWLASGDASFTTGAAINLTGGETISF
jgi:meso-butanediol dehydrogenase/(S,S)-butanediol dehydrogenase/diacetyl reductase